MVDISNIKDWQPKEYNIGDYDRRPWGSWLVTRVPDKKNSAQDFCEKVIIISPGKILSLQSHKLRNETWTVLDGILITIINDEFTTLKNGDTIDVPLGAPHTMANLGNVPCIVKEIQTGVCREDDIVRYMDAYGRITAGEKDHIVPESIDLYRIIEQQTEKRRIKHA